MCFLKLPEFQAIFGPVAVILDGQGTSFRGLHSSDQNVHLEKDACIAILEVPNQIFINGRFLKLLTFNLDV